MRRFLIRNAAGEQVGEGVEWAGGAVDRVAVHVFSHAQTHTLRNIDAVRRMLFSEPVTIDWLDPEPEVLGDGTPGDMPVGDLSELTRPGAYRPKC